MPEVDIGAGYCSKGKYSVDIDANLRPTIISSITNLPFRPSSVSSIVCSHVLEHFEDMDSILLQIHSVLKENHYLFVFIPNDGSLLWNVLRPFWTLYYEMFVLKGSSPKTHAQSYTFCSFRKCLTSTFNILEYKTINVGMEIFAVLYK